MREVTSFKRPVADANDISIHTSHARGDASPWKHWPAIIISIHTSHARGDGLNHQYVYGFGISIHTSHARGDTISYIYWRMAKPFQSTPLMREVTEN